MTGMGAGAIFNDIKEKSVVLFIFSYSITFLQLIYKKKIFKMKLKRRVFGFYYWILQSLESWCGKIYETAIAS